MKEMIKLLNKIQKDTSPDVLENSDYYFNGLMVPRVTKIISRCIHNDGLMYWANTLGFKHQSYKKTLDTAAQIGTECHNNIDKFLETGGSDIIFNPKAENAYLSFREWYDNISKSNKVEVIFHEKTLICQYFGGTLDGLYKINDKIYLVDYKTSNHVGMNYCLQLSAYRYMLRTLLNINIDGCIILQLSKDDISYNEYVMDLSNPIHLNYMNQCEQAFISLVYAYYNISIIDTGYKVLNWR